MLLFLLFAQNSPPLSHASVSLSPTTGNIMHTKTVFMKRGVIMLLQVLSGLSPHAVHALVDPLEEDQHGHEGFQGGFLSCDQVNHTA